MLNSLESLCVLGAKEFYLVPFHGIGNQTPATFDTNDFPKFKNKEVVLKRFKVDFYLSSGATDYALKLVEAAAYVPGVAPVVTNTQIILPSQHVPLDMDQYDPGHKIKFEMDGKSFIFPEITMWLPLHIDIDNIFLKMGVFNNQFTIEILKNLFNTPTGGGGTLTLRYKGFLEIYLNNRN